MCLQNKENWKRKEKKETFLLMYNWEIYLYSIFYVSFKIKLYYIVLSFFITIF